MRDLLAGAAAGCEPHLVLTGKSAVYQGGGQPEGLPPGTRVHADLAGFAEFILNRNVVTLL